MSIQAQAGGRQAAGGDRWYACSPEEVAAAFGMDVSQGLPGAKATELPTRGIDPDPWGDDHLRPGGAVHRHHQPGSDRDRENHYGSVKTGQSIGLAAFSLMLVVAAFEARNEKETAFDTDVFNSFRMNLIAAAEVAGAFLITQADFMRRLLGTAQAAARHGRQ